MDKYFLTIDSGGSKTRLALYGTDDIPIRTEVYQGFGRASDSESDILQLYELLKDFCASYTVSRVICNIGGKNKGEFSYTLKKTFPDADISVFRESEGKIGLVLCDIYSADIVLMVGTGSIAIAPVGDKVVISGGWGPNVSDKGSGYQLGLDAVRLALEELDGTDRLSLLTQNLTGVEQAPQTLDAKEYCEYRDKVRQRLFPLDRAHIASFARVVTECASNGDGASLTLLKNAGEDLASIILSTSQKLPKPLSRIVVTGGMVHSKIFWQKAFEEKIKEKHELKEVVYIADGIDTAMRQMAKHIKED